MDASITNRALADRAKNFTGAEIEGLVRHAANRALIERFDVSTGAVDNITEFFIVQDHFDDAFEHFKPMFAVQEEELHQLMPGGIAEYPSAEPSIEEARKLVSALATRQLDGAVGVTTTVFVEGLPGSGRSALAAYMADGAGSEFDFDFVKVITLKQFNNLNDPRRSQLIQDARLDALKFRRSVIILDDVERFIRHSPMPKAPYHSAVLASELTLLSQPSGDGHALLVLLVCDSAALLQRLIRVKAPHTIGLPLVPASELVTATSLLFGAFRPPLHAEYSAELEKIVAKAAEAAEAFHTVNPVPICTLFSWIAEQPDVASFAQQVARVVLPQALGEPSHDIYSDGL
eukprot:gnl/Ergobibamus_cyprinoides/1667.p1 GENE.gnl/Ergobibamus_cyprinoides/1667~~gnl/Ergobibamus_cyprinoides/1667.p1  ORF type:complete len:359 (-),score=118.14 gnl/Ergobibamus_cyprinoides/1667:165-1202(-)